jgi:hypothetical protein
MDQFPNQADLNENGVENRAAWGDGIESAAHFLTGVVGARFMGIIRRRSRRLTGQEMGSRRCTRQFIRTAYTW